MANEYFGKVSEKGIQIIPDVVTDAAIGALASLVGTILDSSGTKAFGKNMLVKKVHILLAVHNITSGEAIVLGLNANDSGVSSGYGVGNLSALLAPGASSAYLAAEELVKTVWHETSSLVFGGTETNTIDKWISIGGGKGIPVMAGAGPELHAFNPTGDAITTGALVNGVITYYGVWLED